MISESTPFPESIVGATAAGAAQFASTDAAFPQVVWLRGDEPYLESFCLDADAVMAELGIKRSRLTQISGRELRVGRMRVDRYVRPMYRREDVEAYKQWSRATATHQKSSMVLKEAASRLEEQGSMIEEKIQAASSDWIEHLSNLINRQGENTRLTLETWKMETAHENDGVEERLQLLVQAMTEFQDILSEKMDENRETLQQFTENRFTGVTDSLEKLHEQLLEVKNVQNSLQSLSAERHAHLLGSVEMGFRDIQNSMGQLAEVLSLIIHHQKDQGVKTEAMMQKRLGEWSRDLLESFIQAQKTAAVPEGAPQKDLINAATASTTIRSRQIRRRMRQGS